jgi:folate-binding protein YgfZ
MRLDEGTEIVAHYGSVEAEYEALVSGVGVVVRNWPDHLRIGGEDRVAFLNGKVTCELAGLELGEGAYGFLLDAKGHIRADAVIRVLEDSVWLELPAGLGPRVAEHLSRYIVIDRVEIEPLPGLVPLTLVGPGLEAMRGSLSELGRMPDRPWQTCRTAGDPAGEILVSADGRWGMPALTFWPSAAKSEAMIRHLLEAGQPFGAKLVGFLALDRARIEAGIPWFGRDFGESNLPQETGVEEAVSYTKGCYLGQEVVARLHYRGQVSRVLCGLTLDVAEVPEPGTALVLEARQAGTLTSVTRSNRLGAVLGLAILQRRAAEVGTQLEVEGGGHAQVVMSPLTA